MARGEGCESSAFAAVLPGFRRTDPRAGPMALWAARQAVLHDFPAQHADTPIRTDAEGRYCLNDLHRASGGAGHHQPGKFFANKGTQELVAELQGASPNSETPVATINDGVNNGTYVAKELDCAGCDSPGHSQSGCGTGLLAQ